MQFTITGSDKGPTHVVVSKGINSRVFSKKCEEFQQVLQEVLNGTHQFEPEKHVPVVSYVVGGAVDDFVDYLEYESLIRIEDEQSTAWKEVISDSFRTLAHVFFAENDVTVEGRSEILSFAKSLDYNRMEPIKPYLIQDIVDVYWHDKIYLEEED